MRNIPSSLTNKTKLTKFYVNFIFDNVLNFNHLLHLARTASLWEVGQQQAVFLKVGVDLQVSTPPARAAGTGIPPQLAQLVIIMVLGQTKL
jgi:hypothetical protein